MIVINGHELLILLLGNLVGYGFPVDDSSHSVFGFSSILTVFFLDWLNLDVIDSDLSAMPSLTEPALIPVEFIKGITVDMGNSLVFLFRSDNDVWIGYKMLWQIC